MRTSICRTASTKPHLRLRFLTALSATLLSSISSSLSYAATPQFNVIALGPVLSTGDSGKSINSSGTAAFTVLGALWMKTFGVAQKPP
jgi:hypothetical protein